MDRNEKDVSFDKSSAKELKQIGDCSGPSSDKGSVPSCKKIFLDIHHNAMTFVRIFNDTYWYISNI